MLIRLVIAETVVFLLKWSGLIKAKSVRNAKFYREYPTMCGILMEGKRIISENFMK